MIPVQYVYIVAYTLVSVKVVAHAAPTVCKYKSAFSPSFLMMIDAIIAWALQNLVAHKSLDRLLR
jgi:hypothetical protein